MIHAPDGNLLVESYLNWLKTKFDIQSKNEYCEITTPLLDRHNDHLQIYVKNTDKGYYITDDSYIISDLIASGLDLQNKKRDNMLRIILNRYGISRNDDDLFVYSSSSDFAQKKHNLLQAMMAINDLYYTSRSNVISVFFEEVAAFLNENDIRFTDSVQLIGRSGLTHNYDFIIPKSKVMPDRAIKVISNLTRDKAKIIIFSCNDTQEVRKDLIIYPIINDTDKTISKDLTNAFFEYNLKPVLWSERFQHITDLAS